MAFLQELNPEPLWYRHLCKACRFKDIFSLSGEGLFSLPEVDTRHEKWQHLNNFDFSRLSIRVLDFSKMKMISISNDNHHIVKSAGRRQGDI